MPDAAITTDIIVGFPTETEEQFQNTAEIMEKAKFDMAYISKYSPRAGTTASKMADDVSWNEKKRREKILTEIFKKTALENNRKYIGKTVDMLVEKIKGRILFGKTRSFKNVKVTIGSIVLSRLWNQNAEYNKSQSSKAKKLHGAKAIIEPTGSGAKKMDGEFVKVKITGADCFGLKGEIAK